MNDSVMSFIGRTCNSSTVRVHGTDSSFEFEEISEQFIYTQLRKLKTSKAVGLDQMPSRLLKDSASVISKPLAAIMNLSISQGRIPCDWKIARVLPLFKGGTKCNMDNYRPISILPTVSKILERAIHTQLCQFLTANNILSSSQCGFRKGYSTEHAVIALTDHIRRGMDQGLITGSVFIDLQKAFDTVDHCLLIEKLQCYGVNGKELDWFVDYLQNRKQVVQFGNAYSEPGIVSFGVPQCSILGPLLFVLFINDLPNGTVRCDILMYADDTVIFFSAKDTSEIERVLNTELELIHNWLHLNKLFLNLTKTELVLFGTGANLAKVTNFQVTIGHYQLKRVMEYKYLGVFLDDSLTWKSHVEYITTKVGKRLGLLRRTRKDLTANAANMIYKTFILPILDYCDSVWACCNRSDIDQLERLQNRAGRIVMRSIRSAPALARLKWDKLENRRNKHIFKLVNLCLQKRSPQFLHNYFVYNREINARITRQSNLLHLAKVRTEAAKKSFFYNCCVVFNNFKRNCDVM
jgi:hypothetical protein